MKSEKLVLFANKYQKKHSLSLVFFLSVCVLLPRFSYTQDLQLIDPNVKKANNLTKITPDRKYTEEELAFISGSIYESRGEINKAAEYYRKSLKINRYFIPAGTNLAIILFEKEKYRESLTLFYNLYQKHENSPLALNNYGLALLLKGQKKDAVGIFKEGIRKYPRDYELNFNLGTAYYKSQAYNNAKKIYKGTLVFKAKDYATLNNLGCTLIALKEYSEAEKILRQAIKSKPRYSQGYYNLAFVLWKKGEKDQANTMVGKALRRNPNHKMARILKKTILFKP